MKKVILGTWLVLIMVTFSFGQQGTATDYKNQAMNKIDVARQLMNMARELYLSHIGGQERFVAAIQLYVQAGQLFEQAGNILKTLGTNYST